MRDALLHDGIAGNGLRNDRAHGGIEGQEANSFSSSMVDRIQLSILLVSLVLRYISYSFLLRARNQPASSLVSS